MLFSYFIAFMFSGFGLCFFCYETYKLIIWIRAEKIDAKIISVKDERWNDGILQYKYELFVDNKKYELWGPRFETFNPLLIFSPKARLGKTVTVHFDKKEMRIAQNASTSLIFMVCAFLIMICGFLAIALLGIYTGNR